MVKIISHIPLGVDEIYPLRKRAFLDEDYLKKLANTIERSGLRNPVKVRYKPSKKGDYQLLGGYERWLAIKDVLKRKEIPVVLIECTDEEAEHEWLLDNFQKPLSPFDISNFVKDLVDKGWKQEEIAEEFDASVMPSLGLTDQTAVSRYFALQKLLALHYVTLHIGALSGLGIIHLYELSKIVDDEEVLESVVDQLVKDPKMSVKKLKKIIHDELEETEEEEEEEEETEEETEEEEEEEPTEEEEETEEEEVEEEKEMEEKPARRKKEARLKIDDLRPEANEQLKKLVKIKKKDKYDIISDAILAYDRLPIDVNEAIEEVLKECEKLTEAPQKEIMLSALVEHRKKLEELHKTFEELSI